MNNNKKILIPELRFPEFVNDGEWVERILDQIGKTVSGLSGKSAEDFGEGNPYVTYKQVFDNSIIDFSKCAKVVIGKDESQNTLQKGDVLFTTSSETANEIGFASVLIDQPNKKTYLNSFCFGFRPNDTNTLTPEFSRYLFHSSIYRKSISVLAQGSTRFNISKGAFLKLSLPIPKESEQQKIASCLSSLDELLSAQNNKLETLKKHKKGLMQNLFPQEGEKVPRFRFKEFEKDGEWVETRLGVIGNPSMCKRIFKEETTSNPKNGIPFYKIGTFGKDSDSYISNEIYEEYKTKYSFPKKGEILISASGTIGRLVVYDGKPAFFQDSNIVWISNDEKNVKNNLLYYIYASLNWQTSDGGIIQRLYNADLKNMIICYPENKMEQQIIADTLSSLDTLIKEQTNKIAQLKLHKTGLMQGLFPKI